MRIVNVCTGNGLKTLQQQANVIMDRYWLIMSVSIVNAGIIPSYMNMA